MVGLVIVSHSTLIAQGVVELDKQMAGDIPIFAAGGMDNGSLGTSLEKIQEAILQANLEDGVIILADIGSSVMTAQSAIEFLEMEGHDMSHVCLNRAALVEGSLVASVGISVGKSFDEIVDSLKPYQLEK